jgi:preprotein translocase subunit SecF
MSIIQNTTYDGKVVTSISIITFFPEGGKKDFRVSIDFKDGTGFTLKSESPINWEERKK